MHKILALLTALLLLVSLAACADTSTDVPTSAVTQSTTARGTSAVTTTTSAVSTSPIASSTTIPSATSGTPSSLSVTTLTTVRPVASTTKTLPTTAIDPAKEFDLPKTDVFGKQGDKNHIYTLGDNYMTVHETTIDCGMSGEPLEIAHITDTHITYGADLRRNWEKCLRYAQTCDYTVVSGDVVDACKEDLLVYLKNSLGGMKNIMMTLGNHDWAASGVTAASDKTAQYALLKRYWPNELFYSSTVLNNQLMLIQMDNSQNTFSADQKAKLETDIATAREKGYGILLFYHIPLSTGNTNDETARPMMKYSPTAIGRLNFCVGQMFGHAGTPTGDTIALIKNNADVIRGTFCGHLHSAFYCEIAGKTPDGKDALIPQYVGFGARYGNGHVTKITVK